MIDIMKAAEEAEVIIRGFAVSKCPEGKKILNLNTGEGAAIFQDDGTLIESNMDDIELSIAKQYMLDSLKYMED